MICTRVIAIVGRPRSAAEDSRTAAALVAALRAGGMAVQSDRPASQADLMMPRGSREYVTAAGVPLPNGCHWLERAEDTVWSPHRPAPQGVPLILSVRDGSEVPAGADRVLAAEALPVSVDRFGRPRLDAAVPNLPAVPTAPERPTSTADIRICVIGHARHLQDVNPIVIARLADSADAAGIRLEIVITPAAQVLDSGLPADIHGLVLPGGSDMEQVEAQIAAAQSAFERDLPTLGLCLGMQSLAMAGLRRAGWPDAVLEEIDGPGPRRGFVMMRDAAGQPLQRRGDAALAPLPGSLLATLVGAAADIRMHHRYRLAEDAMPVLQGTGLAVAATHASGVPDGIEAPQHRFYVGLQGHPEMGVCPALTGLWQGFLHAAAS